MASIERAQVLLVQRRFDLAERELRGVLASDPHVSHAHSLLALCMLNDEARWPEATQEAEQAITLDPDEAFVHFVLGQVLLTRGRLPEARGAVAEAIRLDPYDADYFAVLAGVELQSSKWQAALDAAVSGLQIDPENVQCNNIRSISLERLGRGNEAVQAAAEALRRAPENSMSHAALGWTALNNGDHLRAQLAFREALRLDPHNEMARDGMISALNSRSFVFRGIYRFYAWLSRFSAQYQFAIIFGAFILMQVLKQVRMAVPALSPLITPLMIAYTLFVLLTWISSSLFNTFLRFHSFGKLLLSRREIWASNLLAMCMSGAVFGGLYGSWKIGIVGGLIVAGYWIIMMLPVSTIFKQLTTGRTYAAAVATIVIGLIPVYAILSSVWSRNLEPLTTVLPLFGWSILGLQIVSNVMQTTPVRR